jgi:rhomboid protease GluP
MKHNYLNAVYTNLILERDYEPLRTEDGLIVSGEELKVLQKYHNQVNVLIELIDGDQFNGAGIGMKLAGAQNMLRKAEPGQIIHWIGVFVFNGAPDAEEIAMISAVPSRQEVARKYLSLFTVNLGAREVIRYTDAGLPVDGLDKLLRRLLVASNDEYATLPDFSQILAQKAREYTMEFKAAKPTVTYDLIGINIVIWVLVYILGFYPLLEGGAKVNQYITIGQYWRLLTPIFLHAGPTPIHVLVNCYSLYVLGQGVERIFGHYKFLFVYIAAGIMGNIASFAFSPHPAVGASGAIFGLLGAILYYGVENPKVYKKYFGYNVITTIVLNVIIGFSLAGIIDNFAHLGGLAGGFLTAGIVRVKAPPDKFPSRNLFLAGILLIAALGLYYGFHSWGPAPPLRVTLMR